MAAKIKATKGLEVELVKGDRGAFEVFAGERLVYSKLTNGRFPSSEQEVLDALT